MNTSAIETVYIFALSGSRERLTHSAATTASRFRPEGASIYFPMYKLREAVIPPIHRRAK